MPTRTTMPPRMSGSTVLVSSTFRPVCSPIVSPICSHGGLVELDGARDLDRQQAVLLLPQLVELRRGCGRSTGMRWFSTSTLEEVQEGLVGVHDRALAGPPSSPRSRGRARRGTPAGRACSSTASANWPSCSAITSSLPCSLAASKSDARVDLGDLLHLASSLPLAGRQSLRSRARPAPPRRAGAGRPRSSALRVTFSVASTVRSATSLRISWIAGGSRPRCPPRLLEQLLALLARRLERLALGVLGRLARARRRSPPPARAPPSAARGTPRAARRPPRVRARRPRSTPRSPAGACRAPPDAREGAACQHVERDTNASSVQIISPTLGLTRKLPPLAAASDTRVIDRRHQPERKNAIRPKMNA